MRGAVLQSRAVVLTDVPGQILKASLDGAVNGSSTPLTNSARHNVLGARTALPSLNADPLGFFFPQRLPNSHRVHMIDIENRHCRTTDGGLTRQQEAIPGKMIGPSVSARIKERR